SEKGRALLRAWPGQRQVLAWSLVQRARLPINIDSGEIAQFCRERGIRKLALCGSVLRGDFNPELGDVDVFAEFEAGALRSVGVQYFDYGHELGKIFGYRVDFC